MSYSKERDEFISQATAEGLSLDTCRKLLRYATTLQRLAEAQCNGDYPYNGDRDRPMPLVKAGNEELVERWDKRYIVCPKCEASGVAKEAMRLCHDKECQCSGTGKVTNPHATNYKQPCKICPDCRTQELVQTLLDAENKERQCNAPGGCPCEGQVKAIFQGDPRGAVLRLATPNYPWSDDGSKGRGLYVPARYKS